MNKQILFTDGSVHTQSKIGYGAYFLTNEKELTDLTLKPKIELKRFESTSSVKLEIQTLIWALTNIEDENVQLTIYTDSQNIIGLPQRRNRLEQNDYRSGKNRLLNNHELYREFFRITDLMKCTFVKVQGHLPFKERTRINHLFALVDKASRRALRKEIIKE